jgi:hypothetical protein
VLRDKACPFPETREGTLLVPIKDCGGGSGEGLNGGVEMVMKTKTYKNL